jgi:hypothetical protein
MWYASYLFIFAAITALMLPEPEDEVGKAGEVVD